ncbi:hypothetical protein K474DRAFT_1646442 [Panus rudis PR-1116 ss-1]|nr:hypothetical protein K474DRAFT_1646442 [Panus rudis PR-1116 ss-1]
MLLFRPSAFGSLWRTFLAYTAPFYSKRYLARILSTFLCSVAVVIRPFSRMGGSTAFLVLALKELVFSVQENLAQQLENTVLNISGALVGIALSTLAKFIASRYPPGSANGRAVCAVFLVVISFFAGLAKSRLPRLQLSTRISCFVSVWILTQNIGAPSRVLSDSGHFLWITLTAAIISLFSLIFVMILIRWKSTSFEQEVANTFALLHQSLSFALKMSFTELPPSDDDKSQYRTLHSQLLARCIKLNDNYSQAAFEVRIGRLSLRSIKPMVGIIEHLRRELAWGMSLTTKTGTHKYGLRSGDVSPGSPVTPSHGPLAYTIGPQALSVGQSILCAMSCVQDTILLAYQHTPPSHPSEESTTVKTVIPGKSDDAWVPAQLQRIHDVNQRLLQARDQARSLLQELFEDLRMADRVARNRVHTHRPTHTGAVAMIALLQMAQEMRHALRIAEHLVRQYAEPHSYIWLPRISLAWLGVPPGLVITEEQTVIPREVNQELHEDQMNVPRAERRQGIAERRFAMVRARSDELHNRQQKTTVRTGIGKVVTTFWTTLFWLWSNDDMLKLRVKLWHFHRSLKNSSHLRHAIKNAVGVALLSFPAFLPDSSGGPRWFEGVHGQWMVISYLWVLETNTGATWRTGYLRILGTIMGAVYGYVAWVIFHANPYGLVALVTLADIPITWWITQTTLGPMAVPASVTLPPIMFVQYVTPDMTVSVSRLALLRALMIGAGMIAALLMNSLVFPRHCRVIFLSDTGRTLRLLSDLYMILSHDMFHVKHLFSREEHYKTLKLELEIRNALYRLSSLIATMRNEFGLLPKPLRHYQRVVVVMQKFLDLLTGLRKIRENIPRKQAVADVFRERREFMSCVCITLFACQHAFQAREPLPQFLPSARHAFEMLEAHIYESLVNHQASEPHAMGLSLVYAFAEQEVMRNMISVLEELLDLTGSLFGASTWLLSDSYQSMHQDPGETLHGWYSTFKWEEV